MHTAALVGRNGSIDWLCMPHFDSPSVFAAILDEKMGGRFQISPVSDSLGKQVYWPETNVLITRFLLEEGVVEVVDYMPVALKRGERGFRQLIRRVEAIRGSVPIRVFCQPAFQYGTVGHTVEKMENGVMFRTENMAIELTSRVPFEIGEDGSASATVTLGQGERVAFSIREPDDRHQVVAVLSDEGEQALLERTVHYWHKWLSKCTYRGRWREMVYRSALLLKLLTFEPTGALVAAPTCSLPEAIGGPRNWDYRYTWIRDASFSLYALLQLGFADEAGAFMRWLEQRCHERNEDGGLQIMYGLHGEHKLPEMTLEHLEGYEKSKPVRVGNGAAEQLQLDIYGELMHAAYLYNAQGAPISWDLWVELSELVEWVCANWQRPDEGIWETRGGAQHFVYSKVMCWVCLDRALKLADERSFPADRAKWMKVRDQIFVEIVEKGWSVSRQAFMQSYGSDSLDAANLIIPLARFMGPNDPRVVSMIRAICQDPRDGGLLSNSLVYRYNTEEFSDGLAGSEGTFNMCTFWLVEALTRAGHTDREKLDQARLVFEKMLGYGNHLGLYAEETGVRGEALGNFPQAFTHLALINAALHLDRELGTREW
jgi:GH15 family glucan-1,4-alpha-glucosidase